MTSREAESVGGFLAVMSVRFQIMQLLCCDGRVSYNNENACCLLGLSSEIYLGCGVRLLGVICLTVAISSQGKKAACFCLYETRPLPVESKKSFLVRYE